MWFSAIPHLTQKLRLERFTGKKSKFTWKSIKSDSKMNFYTGIISIVLFNTIFLLLQPYFEKLSYWKGPAKYHKCTVTKIVWKYRFSRKKLSQRDEFLMVLLKLRFGLYNQDLADHFDISPTLVSRTFTTWIRLIMLF